MTKSEDETPKWVKVLYDGLWMVLKVLLIVGLVAAVILIRIGFDRWYFNWLTK